MKIDEADAAGAVVRNMRFVVGILAGGVIAYCAFAFAKLDGVDRPEPGDWPGIPGVPMLTTLAAAFAVFAVAASFLAPGYVVAGGLRAIARDPSPDDAALDEDDGRPIDPGSETALLLSLFQLQLVLASAIDAVGASFAALAYLVEGWRIALGIVAGTIFLILSRVPTRVLLSEWLDRSRERLALLRRRD